MRPRILVAGVGNIFLGDDAFGVEVARRLATRTMPPSVKVVDYGIRGLDLTFALLEDYDASILVDATPRGNVPGTLYVLEPDLNEQGGAIDTHGMNPMRVLAAARSMGSELRQVIIVGCEPDLATVTEEQGEIGLSAPVEAAVGEAIQMIQSLVERLLASAPVHA